MSNDEQLVDAFRDVIDGIGNEQNLFDLIEDQIFGLVFPVVKNEKKSDAVTGNIMTEISESADSFNLDRNLNRQIARFTSVYLYRMLLQEGVRLQTKGNLVDYPYSNIKEDEQLYEKMKEIVRIFRHPDMYRKADKAFKKLEPMDIVLLQLFGYETYTIDQMEDMLEVDSSFLCNAIMRAKASLLGLEIAEPGDDLYEEPDADSYDEEDEEENDNDTLDVVDEDEKQPSGILAMLFPKLSRKALMGVRCAIIVFFLGNIIFLAFSLVHDMSSMKSKPKQNTEQTTTVQQTTTKESATTKNNNTTAAEVTETETTVTEENSSVETAETTAEETQTETQEDTQAGGEETPAETTTEADTTPESTPAETTTEATTEAETTKTAASEADTTTAPEPETPPTEAAVTPEADAQTPQAGQQ